MIKRQSGFSKIELMISVLLLAAIVLFTVHIFEKQKLVVIKANQNIDIVDIVNQMRRILSDPEACRTTFKGYGTTLSSDFSGLIDIVDYSDTEIMEVEKFSTLRAQGIRYGESQIGISSYSFKRLKVIDTYLAKYELVVTFDRGIKDLFVDRTIPIYLKLNSQKNIAECSLGRIKVNDQIWQKQNDVTYYSGFVSLNTSNTSSSLNINKGIRFLKYDENCTSSNDGMISFSRRNNDLQICVNNKWNSLLKRREVNP